MRHTLTIFCLLWCGILSWAAPPALEIPAEIRPAGQYVRLVPKTDAKAIIYVGLSNVDPVPSELLRDPRLFLLDTRGLPPGNYRFVAVGTLKDEQARADFTVVVGTPPVPPGPGPGPGPVPPQPPPTPGPVTNLRVLIVYETAELSKLPAMQQAVLYARPVRDYLNAKCVEGTDGKTREWRIFDKDVDASQDKGWAEPLSRPRKGEPWIVILSGTAPVYEGPLPANAADTLALLKKFGG